MHFFRDGCVTDFCSCKIGIQYILYITSVLDKIAWSDFEQALPGPKGGGHACMDAGGRATQEQLPRKPGVILMYDLYTAVLCAVLPCPHEKITIFRGALKSLWHATGNCSNVCQNLIKEALTHQSFLNIKQRWGQYLG